MTADPLTARLPWLSELEALPARSPREAARVATYFVSIRSRRLPDHDTTVWPP